LERVWFDSVEVSDAMLALFGSDQREVWLEEGEFADDADLGSLLRVALQGEVNNQLEVLAVVAQVVVDFRRCVGQAFVHDALSVLGTKK
jgi:phosphatidylserine/phosphatidylglycerophosphate/cardiolipin synthase-like enzyme